MIERGTRVRTAGQALEWYGDLTGTVTHLPGDPPDAEEPDGYDNDPGEVWVQWDSHRVGNCWVGEEYLEVV